MVKELTISFAACVALVLAIGYIFAPKAMEMIMPELPSYSMSSGARMLITQLLQSPATLLAVMLVPRIRRHNKRNVG